MKILVPVDGSAFTKRMLAYLAARDDWMGDHRQYTMLHVTPAIPARPASVLDRDILQNHYTQECEKVFKPIRTFFAKQRIPATFVPKVGAAADLIATAAKKGKFDLIVMGSHGHGALGGLVLGSVTTKVLAQCTIPVLIVR